MKIPQKNLENWAQEIIDECSISKGKRCNEIAYWENYFYTGSPDNNPAVYNRCYSHIDRTASFLFSPADLRFNIEFDSTVGKSYLQRASVASRYLSREFHRSASDIIFGMCNEIALRKGCAIFKQNWGHHGLDPCIVHPENFGVLREDITSLEKQEAFVHTTYLTKGQFDRLIEDNPARDSISERVKKKASKIKQSQEHDNYMSQLVIGGQYPIGTNQQNTGSQATAGISDIPSPVISPDVRNNLIRLHELWVQDSERGDYTTIQLVEPGILITGKYKRENLCGVHGDHPFSKVCPNEVDGYFWGRSELAIVKSLQDMLNKRIDEYDMLSQLRANPSRSYVGFNGITDEINSMINSPGGYITESQGGNAKIENLAPNMPQDIFAGIHEIINWFDDVAGFESIMKGQGEAGVRAGVHAETLLRSAGNRMRDRALLVERQCEDAGDFAFRLLQVKEASIFVTKEKSFKSWLMREQDDVEEFVLSQMPDDYRVQVDSHSASPAFSDDAKRMAYELHKAGAIDAAAVLEMVQPPRADILIARAEEKEKAQAQLVQQHPELLTKGKKK